MEATLTDQRNSQLSLEELVNSLKLSLAAGSKVTVNEHELITHLHLVLQVAIFRSILLHFLTKGTTEYAYKSNIHIHVYMYIYMSEFEFTCLSG